MNIDENINKDELLKIGQVAERIDRSTQTIARWYRAQKMGIGTKVILPEPIWFRGKRYFKEEDIEVFKEYLNEIKSGDLAEYNKQYKSKYRKKEAF